MARAAAKGVKRAVREELEGRDQSAQNLAETTYSTALTWKEADGPIILAPVTVSAAAFAPFVAQKAGIPTDPDSLNRVAWYLVARFLDATAEVTPELIREKEAELRGPDAA